MSDKMRWRYGDTNPVVAAVDAGTVIEIGDLLWQDVDDAKPASVFPAESTGLRTGESFADNFLGVTMQRSLAGDTAPIRVATTGVFEFDCPSGTFELGDLIGALAEFETDTGNRLHNQMVGCVTSKSEAIGRVAKREAIASTIVLIDIRSTVMTGGIQ
ncbi:MAG TPA: hypothetical protein VMY37_05045 [Thermoguttaceae bacterium]|nr:hypothetical protein [Thermoguttaceae bacterium]